MASTVRRLLSRLSDICDKIVNCPLMPSTRKHNEKVSDRSQPPMTLNLSLSESAGSRSLRRLVHHLGSSKGSP